MLKNKALPQIKPTCVTNTPRVIVALDIDGVVSPVRLPDQPRMPDLDGEWSFRSIPYDLGIETLVADPVLRLLRDLHEADHVDVHWHTGWWTSAWKLNTHLRMPRWPMFATEGEFLRDEYADDIPRFADWKTAAVLRGLRTLGPNDLLVWVDDEIEVFAERDGLAEELDRSHRLVMVQPQTHLGITCRELEVIRAAARL